MVARHIAVADDGQRGPVTLLGALTATPWRLARGVREGGSEGGLKERQGEGGLKEDGVREERRGESKGEKVKGQGAEGETREKRKGGRPTGMHRCRSWIGGGVSLRVRCVSYYIVSYREAFFVSCDVAWRVASSHLPGF